MGKLVPKHSKKKPLESGKSVSRKAMLDRKIYPSRKRR